MFQQPKPAPNVPQAMIDFVTLLTSAVKDPGVLQPMVNAAQEIAQHNSVTQSMADEVARANALIEQARTTTSELAVQSAELTKAQAAVKQREMEVAKREALVDQLSETLNKQNAEAQAAAENLERTRLRLATKDTALQHLADNLDTRAAELDAREKTLEELETKFATAQQLVGGRK